MPSISNELRRLFPEGTRKSHGGVELFPSWPPDAFAAAAVLVDRSGCYAHPRYTGDWGDCVFKNRKHIPEVEKLGERWANAESLNRLRKLQQLWDILLEHGEAEVCVSHHPDRKMFQWWDAAMRLMMVSDSACFALGYPNLTDRTGKDGSPLAVFLVDEHRRYLEKDPSRALPHLPQSLCMMVPPEEICVQPKSRTAQIGCTLRSLSHNLALLPPIGEVATSWLFAANSKSFEPHPLNLLLVPFPYRIGGAAFQGAGFVTNSKYPARFFEMKQSWLDGQPGSPPPECPREQLLDFLEELIQQSKREVDAVHGVILPELALDEDLARKAAKRLAPVDGLEFFITGFIKDPTEAGRGPRNRVYACTFIGESVFVDWEQSKHHRWMIERSQICRYQLGDRLDPSYDWWERIDLSPRQCAFWLFSRGASLAALVCEDLARIDPVQTVIRSVGPNLVVALLMDGPQSNWRWPGRYATVLADDPRL